MSRTLKRVLIGIPAIMLLLLLLLALWLWFSLRASLSQLDGELSMTGVTTSIKVLRDTDGVVTIQTPNRQDAAYATGFVHAQDRFFQMDLARRYAAGELAGLFGQRAVAFDSKQRRHQMRQRSHQAVATIRGTYHGILNSYVAGVNAGLNSLQSKPFEYRLLGLEPQPWQMEDSALVLAGMYFQLQAGDANVEKRLGWLADCLPQPVFDFIAPIGTDWDAPLRGRAWSPAPLPTPAQLNIRELAPLDQSADTLAFNLAEADSMFGSNNWALSGERSSTGSALVADDMHLGLSVPHIWYRLRLLTTTVNDSPADITGISLPGMPFMVVGSNTQVAWGFTNSYGDWLDLIQIELDPQDANRYLVEGGSEPFRIEQETIQIKDSASIEIDVRHTRWGPIIEEVNVDDGNGKALYAWRWIAHTSQFFVPPALLPLEQAQNITDVIELAPLVSIPAQNVITGDRNGNIGWTIMGRIPLRHNSRASRLPLDWRNASEQWPGWLPAADYPVIINPTSGQLWTANNRQLGGRMLSRIGYGQFGLGARASQVKEGLSQLQQPATPADMQAIQLDDRGLFLARWRQLILDTLNQGARAEHPMRAEIYRYVSEDSDSAHAESVGYRLVREFHQRVKLNLMASLTRQCTDQSEQAFRGTRQAEGPVWQIMQARPMHLLDAAHPDWDSFLLEQIDGLIQQTINRGETLSEYAWGDANQLQMTHPIAGGIPLIGDWLNMTATAMNGDNDMPRVQRPGLGQSQRMAVSPGFESQGYMVMPGGQSGHPLSPFYRSLHQDWLSGQPTAFLPGETKHTLVLKPTR